MPPRQSLVVNISKKCKDPIQYMTQQIKNLCSGDGFYFCPGNNRVLWYPYIEHHAIIVSPKAKYLSKPEGGVMVDEWTDYDEFSESIGQVRELLYRGEDHRIYYGGTYKFALVGDLSQTEFSTLPQSIRDELIRVTFVDPKFVTTPGEKGKIRKMYLSGNAQAVYLALQCVGFNKPLYDALIQTFP
ncbi:hypothetical protein K474DRAFT_1662796 [Panus rudis PR-1116 ss-1]|nr:hypothetical protein K474DRAFT_1662796 [Panus rudis PR-1116 ss-1]